MATVIQQTPRPSFGAALGGGLGQGIGTQLIHELKKQEQQEKMKKFSSFVQAMQTAPDRTAAFNVLSGAMSSGIFEDPQDMNAGFHMLDMMHPLKDQTPHEVTLYDPSGNPQKRFVQASDLPKLSDPNYAAQRFPGLSTENPGPKKPYVVPEGTPVGVDPSGFDYELSKSPQFIGNLTEKNAPPGALPEEAYKFGLEVARNRRADQREERLVGTSERQARAEERRVKTAEDSESNRKADNLRQDLSHAEGAIKTYYGKTLEDGRFGGFDNEDKRKAYVQALEKAKDYIRGGKDYASAVSQAIKDVGVVRADVPLAPNPKPETGKDKQGFFSNFWKGLTGDKGGDTKLSPEQKDLKAKVEKSGQKYDPDKYEYKIVGNQILRKAKK